MKAKVRTGEKVEREIRGEKKLLPTSTDHFVCDDPDFVKIAGKSPKSLLVHFPYDDWRLVFPSGLERWVAGRSSQILTCYTKGDGTAHRLTKGLKNPDGDWKIDPTVLADKKIEVKRREQPCRAQSCPYFGKASTQGCRPQARLNFQLVGGPRDSVYRFETKGLNTIERIEGVLRQYADLRGVEFEMTVEMIKRGAKEFPVVSIREVIAEQGTVEVVMDRKLPEDQLQAHLEATGRWPLSEAQIAWVKKVGHGEALRIIRERDAQ